MAYHGDIQGHGSFRTILKVLPIVPSAPVLYQVTSLPPEFRVWTQPTDNRLLRWSPKFGQVAKSGFCSYNEYGIGGEHETEPKETQPVV